MQVNEQPHKWTRKASSTFEGSAVFRTCVKCGVIDSDYQLTQPCRSQLKREEVKESPNAQ
jgi:hypothetical protein